MLPLDVYLENELEIVQKASGLVEDLTQTVGYKLLKGDPDSRVVVNFHGVSDSLLSFLNRRISTSVSLFYLLRQCPGTLVSFFYLF